MWYSPGASSCTMSMERHCGQVGFNNERLDGDVEETQWHRNFDHCINAITEEQIYSTVVKVLTGNKSHANMGLTCKFKQHSLLLIYWWCCQLLSRRVVQLNVVYCNTLVLDLVLTYTRYKIYIYLVWFSSPDWFLFFLFNLATLYAEQHPLCAGGLQSGPSWGNAVPRDDSIRVLL